ncbi:acylphosphatase [Sphingomonas sp. HITSZ_GF]|uniref:acylphosphatase n=1 Tax=Sphingomonas sp. HITSZ_GF TaxID=3037247 RepID=UPI00240E6577|nr:acylphosphatase [Sphingomonas sp. HITSZ_GF]MDG2532639.1 acylphosphatase [Sphingomonas sp. HITSZ_GF]
MTAQRIYVSGRVQRVGYRDWAVRLAKQLGVRGWVRNLNDGRVELLAEGDDEALVSLTEALREGPPMAVVDNVEAFQTAGDKHAKGFTKRFTA